MVTQRRSVAKSVGCFQRRLFDRAFVNIVVVVVVVVVVVLKKSERRSRGPLCPDLA